MFELVQVVVATIDTLENYDADSRLSSTVPVKLSATLLQDVIVKAMDIILTTTKLSSLSDTQLLDLTMLHRPKRKMRQNLLKK